MWVSLCSFADAQVFVEDGKVSLSVSPGETVTGKLTLHNTSDKNVDMRVYWEDFEYKPPFDGSKDFLPKGSTDHSSADWVNFSTNTLMFGPFAKRTVSYSINVPDQFDKGHYGVLFFENESIEAQGHKGLSVVTRVGCLFFIEPAKKDKSITLNNFQFSKTAFTSSFTNLGNVILIPDGTFYIIDQGGSVFDRGAIEKIYLPPGESAPYSLEFNRDLDPGLYTIVMTIDLDDDNIAVREIDFKKNSQLDFNIIEIRD